MTRDPVLHLLAGSNGAGKSTFVARVLQPVTSLPFVNADVDRASFITETVFSHESKVALVRTAVEAGYFVRLHVILVPADVTVGRVDQRVRAGGHEVPESKIRERYGRLWALVAQARDLARKTEFYDNSSARTPFRLVATYEDGVLVGDAHWPPWTPPALMSGDSTST